MHRTWASADTMLLTASDTFRRALLASAPVLLTEHRICARRGGSFTSAARSERLLRTVQPHSARNSLAWMHPGVGPPACRLQAGGNVPFNDQAGCRVAADWGGRAR